MCLVLSLGGYDGADIRVRFWNWWHRGYNNAFRHVWSPSARCDARCQPQQDKGRTASVGLGANIAVSLKEPATDVRRRKLENLHEDVQDTEPSPRYESASQEQFCFLSHLDGSMQLAWCSLGRVLWVIHPWPGFPSFSQDAGNGSIMRPLGGFMVCPGAE